MMGEENRTTSTKFRHLSLCSSQSAISHYLYLVYICALSHTACRVVYSLSNVLTTADHPPPFAVFRTSLSTPPPPRPPRPLQAQRLAYAYQAADLWNMAEKFLCSATIVLCLAYIMQKALALSRATIAFISSVLRRYGVRGVPGLLTSTPVMLWGQFFVFVAVFGEKSIVFSAFLAVAATVCINERCQLLGGAVLRWATQGFRLAMGIAWQRTLTATPVLLWASFLVYVAVFGKNSHVDNAFLAVVATGSADAKCQLLAGAAFKWAMKTFRSTPGVVWQQIIPCARVWWQRVANGAPVVAAQGRGEEEEGEEKTGEEEEETKDEIEVRERERELRVS